MSAAFEFKKLTPESKADVLQHLGNGVCHLTAVQAAGHTYDEWDAARRNDDVFRRACVSAEALVKIRRRLARPEAQ